MNIHEPLKQYFGYDQFRAGQEELISSILHGRDVLGVMPTGAGKSVCFQLPALLMEGITLVITPLISLMTDQVSALTQMGIRAAYINSTMTERQMSQTLEYVRLGMYNLLYVAPERLFSDSFLNLAHHTRIAMLTVDEAHCISQWGQDFRPSYARIPEFVGRLAQRPIVSAFTATATPRVRDDITQLLDLRDPHTLVTGFDRENLYFEVQRPRQKMQALLDFLQDRPARSGIVYCATRSTVEEVSAGLRQAGHSATRYHAGLSDTERQKNQEDFLFDRAQVMVATNAFGMGIDKSNVSFVVHYNMPRDLESYYQEAGRAGRDGTPAECVLLYGGQDVVTGQWMITHARDEEGMDEQTRTLLQARDQDRLRLMTFYSTTTECLRSYILRYFGESAAHYCGNCGNCRGNFEEVDVTIDAQMILSCVARMKSQYGIKMVIDVLRGCKTERVLRMRLDQLSTYGISKRSEQQLREIISHLIVQGCLVQTSGTYPLLQLGAGAAEVLHGSLPVSVRLSKATQQGKPKKKQLTVSKKDDSIGVYDPRLFDALRELRRTLAQEQKVPPFIILADSALTDMCMRRPANEEELLKVSGVGQVKAERYGERFLQVIARFLEDPQTESVPAPEQTTASEEESLVTVRMIADRVNCLLLQKGFSKISSQKLNDWLEVQGYLQTEREKGRSVRVVTEKGRALGITMVQRIYKNQPTTINCYNKDAQAFIMEHLEELIQIVE